MRLSYRLAAALLGYLGTAAPLHAQTTATPTSPADSTVVTVTGKKPDVERKLDSTVYNTAGSPAGQSGSAADVLNTVPSVTVSPDGNVSLRGNDNVQVYINGKPAAMMQGDNRAATLQSMAGSDIASVEVITNPSAKYDSDGQPIINLVLAKSRKPGANAILLAHIGNDDRANASLSGNYTSGKLNLNGRIGARSDMRQTARREDRTWRNPADGNSGRNVTTSAYPARRTSVSGQAGLEYDLSDTDSITLNLTAAHRYSNNRTEEFRNDYDGLDQLVRDYVRQKIGPNSQDDAQFDAGYSRQADDGSQVKLSARHSLTINGNDRTVRSLFSLPVVADRVERFVGKTASQTDQVSGDYSRPLGDTGELALGFDGKTEINHFNSRKSTIDPVTGAVTFDAGLTNGFYVARRIAAIYATWQSRFGKWQVQPGLRAQGVLTRGNQVTIGVQARSAFSDLAPTLHAAYVLSDANRWTFSYTRSLERPDARDLNPFLSYVDPQTVSSGNPDLKPQSVSAVEAGFAHSHGDDSWTTTAYYRQSRRTITDYTIALPDDRLLTTKKNGGRGQSGGFEAEADGKWGDRWKYSLSGNVFYAELQADDLAGVLRHSSVSYTGEISFDYRPTAADTVHLDGNVNGDQITAQGTRSGTSSLNLTWKRTMTPRLSLTVTANDIGGGSDVRTVIRTATLDSTSSSLSDGRVFFVGLSYRLGGTD